MSSPHRQPPPGTPGARRARIFLAPPTAPRGISGTSHTLHQVNPCPRERGRLIPLQSEPERSYGDAELRSKYINDDGGPSLWWRDARVEQLQERLGRVNAHEAIQQEIVDRVRFQSTEVIERFQRHVDRKRGGQIENADQVLDEFAQREDRRRLVDVVILTLPVLFAGGVIASVFAAFGTWTIVLIVLTIVSLIRAFVAYERRDDGYLGTNELRMLPPPDEQA